MTRSTISERAMNGAQQGVVIGLLCVVFRIVVKLVREGSEKLVGDQLSYNAGFSIATFVSVVYIYTVGYVIARGVIGSLLGTVLFTLCGISLGSLLGYDVWTAPYPIMLTVASVLIGAPLGASVHRLISSRRKTITAVDGTKYTLGPARTLSADELRGIQNRSESDER